MQKTFAQELCKVCKQIEQVGHAEEFRQKLHDSQQMFNEDEYFGVYGELLRKPSDQEYL